MGRLIVVYWRDIPSQVIASAGVGSSKGFSAGVEGNVRLIKDTFFARAQVQDLGFKDIGETRIGGTLVEDVTNTLTGPKGNLNLFVGYPCVKWCKGAFGIPYPCGTRQCKNRKSVASFSTFEKKDVLLCREQSAEFSVLP